MAGSVYLSWGTEDVIAGQSVIIQLLTGSDGVRIRQWLPAVGSPGNEPVEEVMTLRIEGDDHDDLAQNVRHLEWMMQRAIDFLRNKSEIRRVWLNVHSDTTMERMRAEVLRIQLGIPGRGWFEPPTSTHDMILDIPLAILRTPMWEAVEVSGDPFPHSFSKTGMSLNGGSLIFSTTKLGPAPSRINRLTIQGRGNSAALTEFWLGFYPDTSVDILWEGEDTAGGDLGDDTAIISDSGASGGQTLRTTFSTNTDMAQRGLVKMSTQRYLRMTGEFTVVLRAKATGTRTYKVRMADGFASSSALATHTPVKVEKTAYFLHSLGVVTIPPERYSTQRISWPAFLGDYAIRLDAGVLADGTGNLQMDAIYLIPRQDGYCHIKNANVQTSRQWAAVYQEPDGTISALSFDTSSSGTSITTLPLVEPSNYGVPSFARRTSGDFTLLLLGQTDTSHPLLESVNVTCLYTPRYYYLRGKHA